MTPDRSFAELNRASTKQIHDLAARIAIETAETLDKRLEDFAPALLEEIFNHNQRWVVRSR